MLKKKKSRSDFFAGYCTFFYGSLERVTNNQREGRDNVGAVFGGNIHKHTLVNIRFHTVHYKPGFGQGSPSRERIDSRRNIWSSRSGVKLKRRGCTGFVRKLVDFN